MNIFLQSLHNMFSVFFPDLCVVCEGHLKEGEKLVCLSCLHDIPLTRFSFEDGNLIESTFYGRVPVEAATSLFYYDKKGKVKKIIHQLKYRGKEEIGTFVGDWLVSEMKESNRFDDVNCIVPVPLHPKKQKERGYNQVTKFGKSLSKGLQIPFYEDVLIRKQFSKTQTKKHRTERMKGLEEVFEVTNTDAVENNHILLIDDIVTTGATLEACSLQLLKVPNVKISIATMANTV